MNQPHPCRAELMAIGAGLQAAKAYPTHAAVSALIEQAGALVNVVQGIAIRLDHHENPLYLVTAGGKVTRLGTELPEVDPISDVTTADRGRLIVCPYPFDCPTAQAVGRLIRIGGEILAVRGVEYQGGVRRGVRVGLQVGALMSGKLAPPAPRFKVGDRVTWLRFRDPGDPAPYEAHGRILQLDEAAGCAFCRPDNQSGHDTVALSVLNHEEDGAALLAVPPYLNEAQRAYAAAAVAFVWDNEGTPLPSGEQLPEAELDGMLRKLRGQHDPDCECDACMTEVIAGAEEEDLTHGK